MNQRRHAVRKEARKMASLAGEREERELEERPVAGEGGSTETERVAAAVLPVAGEVDATETESVPAAVLPVAGEGDATETARPRPSSLDVDPHLFTARETGREEREREQRESHPSPLDVYPHLFTAREEGEREQRDDPLDVDPRLFTGSEERERDEREARQVEIVEEEDTFMTPRSQFDVEAQSPRAKFARRSRGTSLYNTTIQCLKKISVFKLLTVVSICLNFVGYYRICTAKFSAEEGEEKAKISLFWTPPF